MRQALQSWNLKCLHIHKKDKRMFQNEEFPPIKLLCTARFMFLIFHYITPMPSLKRGKNARRMQLWYFKHNIKLRYQQQSVHANGIKRVTVVYSRTTFN